MWLRMGQDIRTQVKGWILDSVSRRDHFKCTQTCRREREKREIKNLWHHVPRMSAMSLQTTSQHIRVRITSRPVTALQERQELHWNAIEREVRLGMTGQWASSLYITWRNPTNGSEIVLCCQNFHLKGGKKETTEERWKEIKGGTQGRQWEKEREFVRGRKPRDVFYCIPQAGSLRVQKRHKTNQIWNDLVYAGNGVTMETHGLLIHT